MLLPSSRSEDSGRSKSNGDEIDRRFEGKDVGSEDALPGSLEGSHFKIFCMEEEDYVMKLMSTYGALKPIEEGKTQRSVTENGQRINKSFHYTEPFFNHFKFRHQVDDHNNLRHSPISLEESIITKDWKIRVFMLILALVKVYNCLLCKVSNNEPTRIVRNTGEGAPRILLYTQ
jgi:hypothetical protein